MKLLLAVIVAGLLIAATQVLRRLPLWLLIFYIAGEIRLFPRPGIYPRPAEVNFRTLRI